MRFEHDELIAADPLAPVRQRTNARRGECGQGVFSRIQHDEIIAQAMHLDEGYAHVRHLVARGANRNGGAAA